MKKQYTKKQITEAIAYWEKQLEKMNESVIQSRGIDFGGKINLQTALVYAMKLPSEFTLQVSWNGGKDNKRSSLQPINDLIAYPISEMQANSDISIEIITDKEYSDEDFYMLEKQLKKTLRTMFGVGFDVHTDELFMIPYKDKLNRTWYIAFVSFVG